MRWDEKTRSPGRSKLDGCVHENDMDENGVLVSRERKASDCNDTQSIMSLSSCALPLCSFSFPSLI
jgi:hypothetical protein